jgi:ech hydrogenase subunit D
MIENLEILHVDAILERAQELKFSGYRYVTMTSCINDDKTIDLYYSFDKDLKLVTLKTTVNEGEEVPSLSPVYICAAYVENEISEEFGVKFKNLLVDYKGRFFLAQGAPESPFGTGIIIERKDGGK